jgi:hypothetical protein
MERLGGLVSALLNNGAQICAENLPADDAF